MANIGMQGMKYALLVTEGEGAETTYETAKEFIEQSVQVSRQTQQKRVYMVMTS